MCSWRNLFYSLSIVMMLGASVGCEGPVEVGPCDCVIPDSLPKSDVRVEHLVEVLGSGSYYSRTMTCGRDGFVIGGGCGYMSFDPGISLFEHGLHDVQDAKDAWSCQYAKMGGGGLTVYGSLICLDQQETMNAPPDECGCPPVQSLRERIVRKDQVGRFPPKDSRRIESRCSGDNDILIGGSCKMERELLEEDYLVVFEAGFDPDDPDVWRCGWNNDALMLETMGRATAICLRPPDSRAAPEEVPIAERINRKSRTIDVPPGEYRLVEASCEPTEILINGGCALEDTGGGKHDVALLRGGVTNGGTDSWQCAWYNPAGGEITPTGIATAVCVAPPDKASELVAY